jgi:hypothetical protein
MGKDADLDAVDAWLDELEPVASGAAPAELFAALTSDGEVISEARRVAKLLTELVSGEAVLFTAAGWRSSQEAAVESFQLPGETAGALTLTLGTGRLGEPLSPGAEATFIYQNARQMYAVAAHVAAVEGARVVLHWPDVVAYVPGRAMPRARGGLDGQVRAVLGDGSALEAEVLDVSYGGLGLRITGRVAVRRGDALIVRLERADGEVHEMPTEIASASHRDGVMRLGVRFQHTEPEAIRAVHALSGASSSS